MKKKVLILGKLQANPFFDIITKHSQWSFEYNDIDNIHCHPQMILIHWPEQIFDWKEPNEDQLCLLENQFSLWKKRKIKIIYVVNNLKRHWGMTLAFEKLYKIVLKNCDAMVHLGNYSLELYKKQFPKKTHNYIPHPLYEDVYKQQEKIQARRELNISNKSVIIFVPGTIRNLRERSLVTSAFGKIQNKNKILVVPNMFKRKVKWKFKGQYRLKKYFDIHKILEYFYNKEFNKKYIFGYKFIETETLSRWLSAADVVIIPRVDSLNSGILFLGLTFRKIIVGPKIGNIEEFLNAFNLPTFNPDDNDSVALALKRGVELSQNSLPYIDKDLNEFKPIEIALKWDKFLNEQIFYNNQKEQ